MVDPYIKDVNFIILWFCNFFNFLNFIDKLHINYLNMID
jgi:hypothetical protein